MKISNIEGTHNIRPKLAKYWTFTTNSQRNVHVLGAQEKNWTVAYLLIKPIIAVIYSKCTLCAMVWYICVFEFLRISRSDCEDSHYDLNLVWKQISYEHCCYSLSLTLENYFANVTFQLPPLYYLLNFKN